ncbi:hypothetical protein LDENG_00068400 [Lucifuga dentata]|nr:hypothetical protein LDENG_00068400 [Lucifuga dentata]
MKIILLLLFLVVRSHQIILNDCGTLARRPEVSDISTECGTSSISLAIQICPVVYTGYNESLLILNHITDPVCRATLDQTVTPPVAQFNFPLNMTHACGSVFKTTSAAGMGIFSDFSNIQTVNISGVVRSSDPTTGTITYNAELKYFYSCAYPLEYLINNTQIDVSASSISVKDNNGSFISTLSLELFSDSQYTKPMDIPKLGIELRTNVYVEVKATNLMGQYHVLLDRCYASISPLPTNSSYFNLLPLQQNQTVSTYYLHCITRLCDRNTCSIFKQCNRKKRSTLDTSTNDFTRTYTITSPEIITKSVDGQSKEKPITGDDDSASGLGVVVGVLAFVCLVALCAAAVLYKKLRN